MTKEEATKILKDFHDKSALFSVRTALETLYPELKESEDEKIIKILYEGVHDVLQDQFCTNRGVSKEKVLSWLDKQGEQKPADKVEPKFKVKYAGSEYNVFETKDIAGVTFYGIEDEPNHIDYVKAENCEIISVYAIKENGSPYPTKPAVFSEKKPKRMISAEAKEAMYDKPADKVEPKCEESKTKIFDAPTPFEDKLYAFVAACEFLTIPSKIEFILEHSQEILDAAREQIGKEQSSTWSEEDRKMINKLMAVVKLYYVIDDDLDKQRCLSWLKSLKQRTEE